MTQLVCGNNNHPYVQDECIEEFVWLSQKNSSIKIGGFGCTNDILKLIGYAWREFDMSSIDAEHLHPICTNEIDGQNVQKLNASHNQIADGPTISFVNCGNLRVLDLSSNLLTTFNLDFPKNSQLEELHLENNQIKHIEFQTNPRWFNQIRYVNVENNQLRVILENQITSMTNSNGVDNNQLQVLMMKLSEQNSEKISASDASLNVSGDNEIITLVKNFADDSNDLPSLDTNVADLDMEYETLAKNITTLENQSTMNLTNTKKSELDDDCVTVAFLYLLFGSITDILLFVRSYLAEGAAECTKYL